VLLQFGFDRRMAEPWLERGLEALPADADFGTTAELVAGLDLVITVDTSLAHLVGAMQRPGWLLLPFSAAPRWLRQRADSPWYPSLRLFRQREGEGWPPVVEAVLAALAAEGLPQACCG
jgi:ADP-heptose:LPS heptosyltransferase